MRARKEKHLPPYYIRPFEVVGRQRIDAVTYFEHAVVNLWWGFGDEELKMPSFAPKCTG
jgi:hypothetical protein